MFCIRLQMEGDKSDYFVEPRPGTPPAQVAYFEGVPRIGESVYLRSTSLVYKVLDVVYEPLVVAEGLEPRKISLWTIVLILEDPNKKQD